MKKDVLYYVLAFSLFFIFVNWYAPYDVTDDAVNGERSGLGFYTDYGTGCEYLSGGLFGGITPRLDSSGKHMCR